MPDDSILTIMFDHPRIEPMVLKNRRYVLGLLIENYRNDFVKKLLEDPKLDVSCHKYKVIFKAIDSEASQILEKLLHRPEVQLNC